MFQFVETIRSLNGKIENLEYHQWRVNQTFQKFYSNFEPFVLKDILFIPEESKKGIVKIRFLYDYQHYAIEFHNYFMKKINCLKLVECNDIEYSYKFLDRSVFDRLKSNIKNCNEILIVKNGYITDTSFSNIVFFDGDKWITPSTPLLQGTFRKKLLDEGRIFLWKIRPNDLKNYSHFKLINALLTWEFPPMSIDKILF